MLRSLQTKVGTVLVNMTQISSNRSHPGNVRSAHAAITPEGGTVMTNFPCRKCSVDLVNINKPPDMVTSPDLVEHRDTSGSGDSTC